MSATDLAHDNNDDDDDDDDDDDICKRYRVRFVLNPVNEL